MYGAFKIVKNDKSVSILALRDNQICKELKCYG